MKGLSKESSDPRPRVAIITDVNDLTIPLTKKLVESSCRIDIVSEDQKYWKKVIPSSPPESISAVKLEDEALSRDYKYIVFVNLYQQRKKGAVKEKREAEKRLDFAIRLAKNNIAKSLFVFPYLQEVASIKQTESLRKKISEQENLEASVLLIGQLIGPEMDIDKNDVIAQMLKDAASKSSIKVPKLKGNLYPVLIDPVSKEILKILFSFGSQEKEMVVISEPISISRFVELLIKIKPGISCEQDRKGWPLSIPEISKKITLRQNLERVLRKTLVFKKEKEVVHERFQIKQKRRETYKETKVAVSGGKKWLFGAIALFLLSILLPIVLLVVSATSFSFAKKSLKNKNYSLAQRTLALSKFSSQLADRCLTSTSRIPVVGGITPSANLAKMLIKASDLSLRSVSLINTSYELVEEILGEEPYNLASYSEKISLELDYIYKEEGFLVGEANSQKGLTKSIVSKVLTTKGMVNERNRHLLLKDITEQLPELLGEKAPKTYLVLFQNNLESRPTGGVINSFALATFNKGRLTGIDVQDVAFADSQLKGYIEPPDSIKKHLGVESWLLRDSNWDPDFPTSAARAEWFLDKEIDREVDGVIAIDLEFLRRLIDETGGISLKNFNMDINSRNLFELVLESTDSEFLTTLFGELLERFINSSKEEQIKALKIVPANLEEKHIQVFLHNVKAQRAIFELGWDGAVIPIGCSGNCTGDWIGIVEANVAKNYSNYLVKKSAELNVLFEEGVIKRKLLVLLGSSADASQENLSYRAYIRVVAPPDIGFSPVVVFGQEGRKKLNPEILEVQGHKEAGVFVELGPGESKSLLFSWESATLLDYGSSGEYRIYWRKQAGTLNDPIKVVLKFPKNLKYLDTGDFSLTKDSALEYNTELTRDFVSRIFW